MAMSDHVLMAWLQRLMDHYRTSWAAAVQADYIRLLSQRLPDDFDLGALYDVCLESATRCPTISEVLTLVESMLQARPRLSWTPAHDAYTDCDVCKDTGWQPHECPADVCGRRHQHPPHAFVTACPCRPTNPTYRRRRDRERAAIATHTTSRARRQEGAAR
jgi:hypothetical protein